MSPAKDISDKDKRILSDASRELKYVPLEATESITIVPVPDDEVPDPTGTIPQYIQQYRDILDTTDALIELVDARAAGFSVTVDRNSKADVIEAIRKVFGVDTNIITYDMYIEALDEFNRLATVLKDNSMDL